MTRSNRFLFAGFFAVTVALAAFVANPALADIVHMKDGRQIEGKVIENDPKKPEIKIRVKGIVQSLKRTDVAKVEVKATKEDVYEEKSKALAAGDAQGHFELGLWCQTEGLTAQAKKAFQQAIKVDPDHEGARTALGFEKVDGQWLDEKAKKAYLASKDEEEKRADGKVKFKGEWVDEADVEHLKQGLVKVGDQWMTPEDKAKLDQGLVLVGGRWMTKEEKQNLDEGKVLENGKWVSKEEANKLHADWENAWQITTQHYTVRSNKDYDFVVKMAESAEKCYATLKEYLGGMEPKTSGKPLSLFILATIDEYNAFGNQFAPGEEAFHQSSIGCFYAPSHPDSPAVSYYSYDENYKYLWTDDWIWHVLPHQYLSQVLPNITTPALVEGFATYMEKFVRYQPNFQTYRKVLGGSRFIKLKELLDLETLTAEGGGGFFLGYDTVHPTESALLFFYLARGNKPEYKEKLNEFFQKMVKSSSDVQTFGRVFDLAKLEKDFKEWIEDPAHDKAKAAGGK